MNTGLALGLLIIGIIIGAIAGAYTAPSKTVTVTSPTTILQPATVTRYKTETSISVSTVNNVKTETTTQYKTLTQQQTVTNYKTVTETQEVPLKPEFKVLVNTSIVLNGSTIAGGIPVLMPVGYVFTEDGFGDAIVSWNANNTVIIKVLTGYKSILDNYSYTALVANGTGETGYLWFPYAFNIALNIYNPNTEPVEISFILAARVAPLPSNVDLSYLGYVHNNILPPGNGSETISNGLGH